MVAQLLRRLDGDAQRFVTVHRDDGKWEQLAPDIAMKILDSDESMQAFLLRLDAGARLPSHPHASDEMCFVLEGEAALGDLVVGAGDYHLARAGSMHGDVTTRTGCLLLIRYGGGGGNPHREAVA
jgi:anti-sigma factor ChrR (cupin superfamily)